MKQISLNIRDRNHPFRTKHNREQLKTNKNDRIWS